MTIRREKITKDKIKRMEEKNRLKEYESNIHTERLHRKRKYEKGELVKKL